MSGSIEEVRLSELSSRPDTAVEMASLSSTSSNSQDPTRTLGDGLKTHSTTNASTGNQNHAYFSGGDLKSESTMGIKVMASLDNNDSGHIFGGDLHLESTTKPAITAPPDTAHTLAAGTGHGAENSNKVLTTSRAGTKPLTEFTVFPNLPQEIRDMIWMFALPGPRVVVIYQEFDHDDDDIIIGYQSDTPPPTTLQVCSDSRKVALKHYTLSFGVRGFQHSPGVFFDYDIDTLFIRSRDSGERDGFFDTKDFSAVTPVRKVKNLAVHLGFIDSETPNGEQWLENLSPRYFKFFTRFSILENLTFCYFSYASEIPRFPEGVKISNFHDDDDPYTVITKSYVEIGNAKAIESGKWKLPKVQVARGDAFCSDL